MAELSLENILETEELDNLFLDEEDSQDTSPDNTPDGDKKDDKETTEIVNVNELFANESESVGSEDNNEEEYKEKEDTKPSKGAGSSPNKNFYSSIADALREEGIFPDLDNDTIANIKAPEDFAEAIEKQVQAKLDERQKRIDNALNADVEPSLIRNYENTISYLDSIQESTITDEGESGENLRKQLIYQDYINKGFSKERAQKAVQRSFNAGTDVEDAKEALESNKEFFNSKYDELVQEAQEEKEREKEKLKNEAETLKKSILEDSKVFGDIQIDKTTRAKIFNNISKPVYKDPETGVLLTALQKYEKENKLEFIKNLGIVFTLTDGFKNIDGFVKPKVRKEVKNSLKELEHTLNNTARTSDGNLKFVSGVDDTESFISKGWNIDV